MVYVDEVCKGEEKIQIISCPRKKNYNSCIAIKNKMCVSSRRSCFKRDESNDVRENVL